MGLRTGIDIDQLTAVREIVAHGPAGRAALWFYPRCGPAARVQDGRYAPDRGGCMTIVGTKMVSDGKTARQLFDEVMANPARAKFGFGDSSRS